MKSLITAVLILIAPSLAIAVTNTATSKTSSYYTDSPLSYTAIPAADTIMVTMPLPTKYRSKKHTLLITTMVQETCGSMDNVASTVIVGGVTALGGATYTECGNNNGQVVMVTRTWVIPSEAQGGTPIPAGSNLELHMQSSLGFALRAQTNVHIVAVK